MTVCLGYVPTAEGRAALGFAIRECAVRSDRLLVVVTADVVVTPEFGADLALSEASLRRDRVEVRTVDSAISAASELIDLSYEDATDLLVIGLRRRSPAGKFVMGSTSQQVLLAAGCPVTAVKAPAQATRA